MDGLADPFGVVLVAVSNDTTLSSLNTVVHREDANTTKHYCIEGA